MQLAELLQELRLRGMSVTRQGDQLKIAAPPDSLTPGLREKILRHKPSLLQWLRELEEAAQDGLPACVPDPDRLYAPFPLADLQFGFFMADSPDMEFHVRPHYYNETDWAGLDVERYQHAWNKALRRHHGGLVVLTAEHALQTLRDPAPLRCTVQDLRGLPPAGVAAALAETRAAMMRCELPLDRWPWIDLRVSLWREDGQERARIHYNHNNFFSDGYGTVKLLREVELYYREPDQALPPLSLSYRDAVLALEALARSGQGQAAQRYWEERLPLMPEPPPLPLRASLERRCRSRLQRREGFLPAADWAAFKANAARCGVTPSNAIFAAYAEVLSAWSNSRHFVLANMMTRRLDLHPEMRAILGNFASLYPLEIDLRGDSAFSGRARRIQEQVARDALHLQWGGMRVMQAWNRKRGAALGTAAIPFVIGSGLFMEDFRKPDFGCLETSQVMLDHQFNQLHDGRYYYMWDVLEEFFLPGVLDQMQQAYEGLLQRLAAQPAAWNAATPDLLPPAQMAARAAATPPAVPLSRLRLDDFLRDSAAATPGAAALQGNGTALGYAALLAGASGVAQQLRQACPALRGRNVVVACERGAALLRAVHGVLLAGAAYVPLDPELPPERLRHIVQDSAAGAVLVQRRYLDRFDASCPVLVIEDIGPAAAPIPPTLECTPDDLAYLIYTSGSTGKPKGVMIEHQAAVNTILDINRRYAVHGADRLFGISSFGFDLSVYDLFGAAAAGAALVYPEPEQALNPSHWLDLMLAQGVTIWNSAPPLAVLLADSAAARGVRLPALRLVMLSGDWIPVDLPDKLRRCAPHARVVSLGGATEASIWSILYDIATVDPAWSSIPYGYPMTNQPWRILDAWGRPAPDWVTGELYIGGAGLARGYWNNPQQSAAAFVTIDGERLYRTGDIGRYQPGGLIEFLGRRDQQVKIAGHRIELGEIESVLAAEPEINSAVVVVRRGSQQAQAWLDAYVTASGATWPDGERLKRVLASKLPAYMVPRAIQVLERLPLNASGKVDRNALPALAALPAAAATPRIRRAPRDHWESGLLQIWRGVLGQPELGVTDDFFEAGGQSFEAVRILGAIRDRFAQSVSLGVIWRDPTVEGVAAVLRAGSAQVTPALLPLRTEGSGIPLYLVHPAGGQVVRYRQLSSLLRRPVHGFQATSHTLAGQGIKALAAAYVAELEVQQPAGALVLGGWSSGAVIAFEMAAQLLQRGREVQALVLIDCPAPQALPAAEQRTLLAWFVEDCALGLPVAALMAQLPELPADPQAHLELAAVHLQAMGYAFPVEAAQMTAFYRVFCAVVQATRAYQPDPLPLEVLLLRARHGNVSEFAGHPCHADPDWGWRGLCRRLTLAHVPGTHHSLLTGGSATLLGTAIETWLAHLQNPTLLENQ